MRNYRKRKGRAISGWLILDKPCNMGSTEAVSFIKRLFDAQRVGHAGTLDPLASGMLPIALGDATKTVNYVMEGKKTYHFKVAWGAERTTDDLEGEVVHTSSLRPSREAVEALLPQYLGNILQLPPLYSALKVNGVRAYDLMRSGEQPLLQPRPVEIFSFELLEHTPDYSSFQVCCGKGTYIRSLARDLGRALNCYGYVAYLRRISVLPFSEGSMITTEQLRHYQERVQAGADSSLLLDLLLKPVAALNQLPQLEVNAAALREVSFGRRILVRDSAGASSVEPLCLCHAGEIISLGYVEEGFFYPKKVFLEALG